MAAISKNKYDVYSWIKTVIDSCQNHLQWVRCTSLLRGFRDIYQDDKLYREVRMYYTMHITKLNQRAENEKNICNK